MEMNLAFSQNILKHARQEKVEINIHLKSKRLIEK